MEIFSNFFVCLFYKISKNAKCIIEIIFEPPTRLESTSFPFSELRTRISQLSTFRDKKDGKIFFIKYSKALISFLSEMQILTEGNGRNGAHRMMDCRLKIYDKN
jgi:hypothetical protein